MFESTLPWQIESELRKADLTHATWRDICSYLQQLHRDTLIRPCFAVIICPADLLAEAAKLVSHLGIEDHVELTTA